ncbi:MAG: 3-hydroxyacyl-CoA dehydrogenase [Actinobacteria bacterium]|nr:3-hydroxyacyl-CoA dehydrogenase [Actinomycetota bacterium]
MKKVQTYAVVGSGSIGNAWAIVFARARKTVQLFDIDPSRLISARSDIEVRLNMLSKYGLLKEDVSQILERISYCDSLELVVRGAEYIQECAPERIEVKREIFKKLDALTDSHVILASSSSAITTSEFAREVTHKERCLIVHPGNPPYLLPVAEVVPAPFTDLEIVKKTMLNLREMGMSPILVHSEIEGFVFNRLQGAMLREAYCLVRDGIVTASDLDRIVTQGLARRWTVVGPFATSALNVHGGIKAHVARMGASYERMGTLRGQSDPWTPELVEQVSQDIDQLFPIDEWNENVMRRDEALLALTKLIANNPTFDLGY